MNFDCTKPLGDKLELYLQNDISVICDELRKNGIVYERQFESLISMLCNNNSLAISELFSEKSELDIFYGYDKETRHFVFYDTAKYSMEEAIKESISYQKSQGNC